MRFIICNVYYLTIKFFNNSVFTEKKTLQEKKDGIKMKSILIKSGKIIDGTGKKYTYGDILIKGNKIIRIEPTISNVNPDFTINAESLCVSPGFIDTHSHSDLNLFKNPYANAKLFQGVTTEIVGNCGFSIYPYDEKSEDKVKGYVSPILGNINKKYKCNSVRHYFDSLKKIQPSINVGALIGHGSIRTMVKGFEKEIKSFEEINRMKEILELAMQEGALGMSAGLAYAPGSFSTFDEIKELCKILSSNQRKFVVHLRDQGKNIYKSIKETIQLNQETNVETHISHLKVIGIEQSGQINDVLNILDDAFRDGIIVTSDVYPYTAGSTMIARILPDWILEGKGDIDSLIEKIKQKGVKQALERSFEEGIFGWENLVDLIGWENIIITSVVSKQNKFVEGLSIMEISKKLELSSVEIVCKLIIEEKGQVIIITQNINEKDLQVVLKNPMTMIGTDGIYSGKRSHPRLFQTFPRVLGNYVGGLGILSLEEAVRKMTSLAANTFNLENMGIIKPGYYADIVIFDEKTIKDTGTFKNPDSLPKGINYVIVNGQIVVENGKHTSLRPGRIIVKN